MRTNLELLTIREAAAILRVHPATIYTFFKQGALDYVKVGRRRRIRAKDLETYIDENTISVPELIDRHLSAMRL